MKKKLCIIAALLIVISCLFSGCSERDTEPEVFTFSVIRDTVFGSVILDTTDEEFEATGLTLGDSVNVKFSSGYTLEDIPYYNGYYNRVNKPALVNYPNSDIAVAFCLGDDLWVASGSSEGDTVEISLCEKGKYLDAQEAMNMVYTNDRSSYDSNEEFANFRAMSGGALRSNTFYRGVSPLDNENQRAETTDLLLEKYGIEYVLNLTDTDEKISGYTEESGFCSENTMRLYNNGKLDPIGLSVAYRTDNFKAKLIAGLRKMSENDGPYYIHCTEGKDRTGFVCLLLEALAGANVEEIENDYMMTYANYYNITEDGTPGKYKAIIDARFNDMLWWLEDVPDGTDLTDKDLSVGARNYLLSGGMTEAEIDAFVGFLTGEMSN